MEKNQASVQNENTQMVPLTLENVPYSNSFRIKSGSVGQLMRGLLEMQNRITVENETDDYKKVLYPKLRELSQCMVEKFREQLKSSNNVENDIKNYNLMG